MTDPLRIHLSLVSHTNIGKTTLARTLLMRDVGEIADRAHVTETTDDYVLARAVDGSELVLWDTPGFGNSVQLAKRLEGRANPVGWFLSEVWDRLTNKAFWLDQRAVRHIRDTSSVVLYLVNAEEIPERSPYVPAEMKILSWVASPSSCSSIRWGRPGKRISKRLKLPAGNVRLPPTASLSTFCRWTLLHVAGYRSRSSSIQSAAPSRTNCRQPFPSFVPFGCADVAPSMRVRLKPSRATYDFS